ncbi:hypothetical protein OAF16_04640 [Flavobacteriales bacterium]|nr:hypothetical protein [Flavobacteriales bacterium]
MKKIFIVLVVALTFVGCSKPQREVYAEATLLANPDNCYLFALGINSDEGSANAPYDALDFTPETVGTTKVTQTLSLTKGVNMTYGSTMSYINTLGNSAYSFDFEVEIRIYVNGNLEETQIATTSGSFGQDFNFIVP